MKFTSPYPLAPYHTILKRQIPTDSGILNCLKAILFNEVIGQKITLFSLPENIIQTSIRIVIEKKEGRKEGREDGERERKKEREKKKESQPATTCKGNMVTVIRAKKKKKKY